MIHKFKIKIKPNHSKTNYDYLLILISEYKTSMILIDMSIIIKYGYILFQKMRIHYYLNRN